MHRLGGLRAFSNDSRTQGMQGTKSGTSKSESANASDRKDSNLVPAWNKNHSAGPTKIMKEFIEKNSSDINKGVTRMTKDSDARFMRLKVHSGKEFQDKVFKKTNEKAPIHTEEHLIRGCNIQASWDEKSEVLGLVNSVMKMCRLNIVDSDKEWNDTYHEFVKFYTVYKAKLTRQSASSQSKYDDLEKIVSENHTMTTAREAAEKEIIESHKLVARKMKRKKEIQEYENISKKILKNESLFELRRLQDEETKRKDEVENDVSRTEERILSKQLQVQVVLNSANHFLESFNADCLI